MLFLLYRHADDVVFDDFRRFPTTFRRFPKIAKIVPKARRTFPNIFRKFPKMSEDVRRFPMIAEDFRGRPEDVSMIHQRIKVQFKRQTKAKGGNRDVIKRYDTHKGSLRTQTYFRLLLVPQAITKVTYGKYATRVPDGVAYGIYEWFSSQ